MIVLTKYKRTGEIINSRFVDITTVFDGKDNVLGKKARVTLVDGRSYSGFVHGPTLINDAQIAMHLMRNSH